MIPSPANRLNMANGPCLQAQPICYQSSIVCPSTQHATAVPHTLLKGHNKSHWAPSQDLCSQKQRGGLQGPQHECVCSVGSTACLPGIIAKSAKSMQQLQRLDHCLCRRRCQPIKLHDVVDAHGLELQHCAAQRTPLHLWHTAVRKRLEVLLCAQPEAEAGSHSASASCSQEAHVMGRGEVAGEELARKGLAGQELVALCEFAASSEHCIPALCAALALLIGATSRDSRPVRGLYACCLAKQLSTTYTTPSRVTDVSAMLVAATTCGAHEPCM